MDSLSRILEASPHREALIREMAGLLEAHIAGKSGIKGMAMKTGFSLLRKAKPDLAQRAVKGLLPDIASALDGLHGEFQRSQGSDLAGFLRTRADEAVPLASAAIERRIETSGSPAVQKVFRQFKGSVAEELRALLPAMGAAMGRQLG